MSFLTKQVKPAEAYQADYERAFISKAKALAHERQRLVIPQSEMARLSGCSLRKIQSFEAGSCFDAYLLYIYNLILRQK
jgi:hypothetical protein